MTPHQKRIQESLVERYERVRGGTVDPRDDNALKITTDGRKLALDARLVFPSLPETEGKLDAVADQVTDIWHATASTRSTQLIFCDLGVSDKEGQFSVYDAIVRKLVERGIPAQEIACIGDYDTDLKKARLFTKVRSGDVRVLLGSTQKMGTGTNVQQRLYALHHVDAPWKPAEVEQREGRILRQGNSHDEVEIYRYVTEGSFDAYMWQTLQTKAEFINQIMKGDMSIRRTPDLDDQTLSYAEVKAIASGNPAVLTLARIEMEAQRLTQLARAHTNEQYRLRQTIRQLADAELPMLTDRQSRLAHDLATLAAHGGQERPTLIVEGQRIADPKVSQEALREMMERHWEMMAFTLEAAPNGAQERARIGSFGGLEIELALEKGERISGALTLKGQTRTSRTLRGPGSDRLLTYLHELADSLPGLQQETATKQRELETHLASLQTRLGLPFAQEALLTQLAALKNELQALLQTDPRQGHSEAAGVPNPANPASPTTLTPEAAQARIQALVAAFDALMKGEASAIAQPAYPAAMSAQTLAERGPARPWVERMRHNAPRQVEAVA